MTPSSRQHHASVRLPLSLSIIFGSFTLGFYVAIQGPTLMDLIDILHVNNDIMSHSLAVASLAYSLGGLLSGMIFDYVDRQMLIPAYYVIFGLANIITPYITNYYVFSVITVFKMMCAGGTDCGANVWILNLWPGQDAWLQALHFSFACGCALGPLVVEPFLSASEHKDFEGGLNFKDGHAIINETSDSRIYIPYGVSGSLSLLAAFLIVYLYIVEQRHLRQDKRLALEQQITSAESIPLTVVDGNNTAPGDIALELGAKPAVVPSEKPKATQPPEEVPLNASALNSAPDERDIEAAEERQMVALVDGSGGGANNSAPTQPSNDQLKQMKFSSKAKEQREGRPPYYVMFAITLAAMCLSFYCGIEITSMNYLATFAVNIDLQLPKSTAALMSSALTISFAVGRLFGIWIAAYMRPHKLFYLCAAVMALGNVSILLCANTVLLLWCSICLFGIGCGPMYASIVSFYDDKIAQVTNTVSGIFILGSMFNVALNTVIIGHYIIDNALILIVCNLLCAALLLCIFGSLHLLTKIKMHQRRKKFLVQQTKCQDSIKQQQQQQQQQEQPNSDPHQTQQLISPPTPPPITRTPTMTTQQQEKQQHQHQA